MQALAVVDKVYMTLSLLTITLECLLVKTLNKS